ncbi:alanine racemase, partial [Actinotignum sp. GS-2025b]|uniref:alanine racemase n=1 Tax=Actinotignum sp. GS-2025b TaxID=3427275 RepID=UPI003F4658BF
MFSLDPAVFTSRATISLGALEQNLTRVRAHLTGQKIMAVIKGDAYGHGLLPAARAQPDCPGHHACTPGAGRRGGHP